jgi:exosortase A-associated hydrolase 1
MTRLHLSFPCEGAELAATIDHAPGATGLLLVSGGNETRAGAFSGQARLAARLAEAGYSVFRFDRRGVGDSEGDNAGFRHSQADIAASIACFRAQNPLLERIIGFGNCDAASALMLGGGTGLDGLILANPWTFDQADSPPPPAAIRARYAEKLANPRELWRLVSGKVSIGKLLRGIGQTLRPAPPPSNLATQMAQGLARFSGPIAILLAGRDRTAQAFAAGWPADDPRLRHCPGASHGFVEPEAAQWLLDQICSVLGQDDISLI